MISFKEVEKIESWKYILNIDIPSIKLRKGTILTNYVKEMLLKNGYFFIPVIKNYASDVSVIDNELIEKSYEILKRKLIEIEKNGKLDNYVIEEVAGEITDKIEKNFGEYLYLPLKKLKEYDEYTYTHSLNVGLIAGLIGKTMNFETEKINKLIISGILHDVGKSRISFEILNAPRQLTIEEYSLIKKHVIFSKEILLENGIIDEEILDSATYHHERFDGKGYFRGLKGYDIPLFGRITSISDVYDALTSKRIYKNIWNNYKVVSHIIQNSNKMFDPEIVSNFIKTFGIYPPGTRVVLSDKRFGTVVASRNGNEIQPLIQIDEKIIDLKKDKIFIKSVIEEGEEISEN